MCGISVIISKNELAIDSLIKMNASIKHRGPDDEGFVLFNDGTPYVAGGDDTALESWNATISYCPKKSINELNNESFQIGFGHRRLSILDLSPNGHQPMCSINEKYWITFNGEIYNFKNVKIELEKLGCLFKTHTDTEVLINAYSVWGKECLNKLKGMWSFVIFDKEKNEIFACRDRFGIKPLYYFIGNNTLSFASEIKQFTQLPNWEANLNPERAIDYLVHSFSEHTDETMFRGVFQIKPGHYFNSKIDAIDFDLNKIVTNSYYELQKVKNNKLSYEDSSLIFKEKFLKSCNEHLFADVKIGSCLSGGLDSTAIVCASLDILGKEKASELQETFTACVADDRYNEKKWVEIIKQEKNINTNYIYPEMTELFNNLESIVYSQDEPFGSSSIFLQYKVFEAAHNKGIKVMLDGQGADEQLSGYTGFINLTIKENIQRLNLKSMYYNIVGLKKVQKSSPISGLIASLMLLIPANFRRKLGSKSKNHSTFQWLALEKILNKPYEHPLNNVPYKKDDVKNESLRQLTATNLQKLLHWEDRNSMHFSIEARVPFLDHEMVEFNVSLNSNYKVKGGWTKRIMRDALKGILPEQIANRKDKIGFVPPEELFMRNNKEFINNKLNEVVLISNGLITKKIIEDFNAMLINEIAFDYRFWRAICFGEWIKVFKVKLA